MDYKKLSRIADYSSRTHKVQDSVKKFDEVDAQDELNKLAKSLGDGWNADADWGYGELSFECLSEDDSEFEETKKKAQKFLPKVKKVFGNAKVEDDGEFMVYITVEYKSEEDSEHKKHAEIKDSKEITEDWVKDVHAKLSPDQIMELVDEVTDFHGDLFEVSEPTVWFLQGNGLGDVTEVKLSEIVSYIKKNARDEKTAEDINTVEDALDWLYTHTDGYDVAYEPGVYWVSDDSEFSAIPVETIADLCELNPEYFSLNVSDDIVKGWYEQAKAEGNDDLIDGIEWNYRSEDWVD